MPIRSPSWQGALAVLAGLSLPAATAAQDERAPGGQRLTGTLTQTFGADTNFGLSDPAEDTSYRATTTLGLTYLTETQIERFQLDSDVTGRALRNGAGESDLIFTLPSVQAAYAREAARARFETSARFREDSVAFLNGFDVDLDEDGNVVAPGTDAETIDEDAGFRTAFGGDVAVTLGVDTPVELTFGADVAVIDYREVEDPDLNDTRRYLAFTAARLRISPVLDGTLRLQALRFEADDDEATERDQLTLSAGLDYAASQRLTLTSGAFVTYQDERTDLGDTESTVYGADLGAAYDIPAGTLSGRLGFATTDDDAVVTTAGLGVTLDLAEGELRGALDRSLTLGDAGEDIALTAARLDFLYPINSLSGARFGATYSLREDLDADGGPDESRLTLSLGYDRQITRSLSLAVDYSYRLRDEGPEFADSHGIAVGLVVPLNF